MHRGTSAIFFVRGDVHAASYTVLCLRFQCRQRCCRLVICSRNRVPWPGSKIHYPVPNRGNWYPVFALITSAYEKCYFGLHFVSLCDDFSLFATIVAIFVHARIQIWSFIYGRLKSITNKNIGLWKIFGNWVCTCYRIVIFPYLFKSWNRVRVIATGYPVPKTGNAANHYCRRTASQKRCKSSTRRDRRTSPCTSAADRRPTGIGRRGWIPPERRRIRSDTRCVRSWNCYIPSTSASPTRRPCWRREPGLATPHILLS